MWSDPVLPADEGQLDARGFAPNAYRGQGCVFGSVALDEMKKRFGITHVLRAHQAKSVGITLAKQARVLTVQSPQLVGFFLITYDGRFSAHQRIMGCKTHTAGVYSFQTTRFGRSSAVPTRRAWCRLRALHH